MCVCALSTRTFLKSETQIKEPCRRLDSSRRAEAGGSTGAFIETTVVKGVRHYRIESMLDGGGLGGGGH